MAQKRMLTDSDYMLQKFPGKGGWTYAEIPEILPNKQNPFGWVKVNGRIDQYELKYYKLMPMGNGHLFLPVKKAIRKSIRKEADDIVHITLFETDEHLAIPDELMNCFKHEAPLALETFQSFTENQQKTLIDWIYEAKTDVTKVKRISEMMQHLADGLKFHDRQ